MTVAVSSDPVQGALCTKPRLRLSATQWDWDDHSPSLQSESLSYEGSYSDHKARQSQVLNPGLSTLEPEPELIRAPLYSHEDRDCVFP